MEKTLEEVKEYFKDAIKVRDYKGDKGFVELEKIKENKGCFIQNPFKDNWIVLYHKEKGYAKIKTIKEKNMYTITKEQILELENGFTLPKLKEWFPEVFETKLEVGKWYRNLDKGFEKSICCVIEIDKEDEDCFSGYGIDADEVFFYGKDTDQCGSGNWKEATEQEVKTALENESNKRYKIGDYIIGLYSKKVKCLTFESTGNGQKNVHVDSYYNVWINVGNGYNEKVFENGVWTTIIPTLTKKEAEEKLGVKII